MIRNLSSTFTKRISNIAALSVLAGALLATTAAQAQTCPAYPIALSAQTLAGATAGTVLSNIWNGAQPGNFGWLSWTGDPGEPTLVDSLTQPGDSNTYVDPNNPANTNLIVGVWVSGRPGVANGKQVRKALTDLTGVAIIVPVWDQVSGQGANAQYHISAFAVVQILNYNLPSQNRITAQFLGYADCFGVSSVSPKKHSNRVTMLASRK